MKLSIFFFLTLFFCSSVKTYSQDKKVAVVTFYADKSIDLSSFGAASYLAADLVKLQENPDFNLSPMLADFHTRFLQDYSKSFPFQLVPEAEVLNSDTYKAIDPYSDWSDVMKTAVKAKYSPLEGYKAIDFLWGTQSAHNLPVLFKQYDGVMFVFITFKLIRVGFAGMGVTKIEAYANMVLYNNSGSKVFNIREYDSSKKVSPLVGGVPVMTPEKLIPMCESALTQLMDGLQKKLPKIIKKTEAKL